MYMQKLDFQVSGRPPSLIHWARIGTAREEHLLVFIVEQYLVEIDFVIAVKGKY